MISRIIIDKVASYKDPVCIETNSKVNLFYGLNGSGKTTISDYLYDLDHDIFSSCSIDGFNRVQQNILVYNERFVAENFRARDVQKGIFTLAKGNQAALEIIEQAKRQKLELQMKLNGDNGLLKQLEDLNQRIDSNTADAQSEVWEIRRKYTGGDRVFDIAGFLDQLKGSKRSLFDYLISIDMQNGEIRAIEEVKSEVQELREGGVERKALRKINVDFSGIEFNPIFQEPIVGNENSVISLLINKLGNSDWVQQGIKYLPEANDQTCPFCQQSTLTFDLQTQIRNYFDETYNIKVATLIKIKESYKLELQLSDYMRDFLQENDKEKLRRLLSDLRSVVETNISKIYKKINTPSESLSLVATVDKVQAINNFIDEKNEEIKVFNGMVRDKESTIKKLKMEFWQCQRSEYNHVILRYNKTRNTLYRKRGEIVEKIKAAESEIGKLDLTISEQQKKVTNIDQTIDEINNHLIAFGIQDFNIVKHDEFSYRIKRPYEEGKTTFKSLSEGEKTVISFLYFVELCRGMADPTDTKRKIVVIDDPISSLSHMYVFNIAQLIKRHFTGIENKNFIQCFILTHSLYFFHELVDAKSARSSCDKKKNHQKFFRIHKGDRSLIKIMGHNEIRNEYEVYWDLVKNASHENMPLVANAMRNIIEYFFGFFEGKNNLNDIFQKNEFNDAKYQSFKRYINRESHGDPINIHDYKEWDLGIFTQAFRDVFYVSGNENHYNKYIQ